MRHVSNKAFPHPVLRTGSTDYTNSQFSAILDVQRIVHTTQVKIVAEFTLTDPTLLELIEARQACYAVLVKCPKTFLRQEMLSYDPSSEITFKHGQLLGSVEASSFIVSTAKLNGFRARNWHHDFDGLSIDLDPGSVLAIYETKDYWIDTIDEEDIGSIIDLRAESGVEPGHWTCDLSDDRIKLLVDSEDYEVLLEIRKNIRDTEAAVYLLNGFYLPVVIYVLMEADSNPSEYQGYRWFAALNDKLATLKSVPLGSQRTDRAVDAQKIFKSAFGTLISVMNGESFDSFELR